MTKYPGLFFIRVNGASRLVKRNIEVNCAENVGKMVVMGNELEVL